MIEKMAALEASRPKWTDDEMQTAMCLWEAWLDLEKEDNVLGRHMQMIREDNGAYATRSLVAGLVIDCDLAWDAYTALDGDDIAFDWEFVPEFLTGVVESGRLGEAAEEQWKIYHLS